MSATRGLHAAYREHFVARSHLKFALERLRGRQPLLVNQMGKVGTSTVLRSLRSHANPPAVLHFHHLNRERLDSQQALYRARFASRRMIGGHVLRALLVRRLLAGWPPRPRHWKIVTLIRDPLRRNVSAYFQALDLHYAHLGFTRRIRAGEVDDDLIREMVGHFVAEFPHLDALRWFDEEIRVHFGVDVLADGFPHHDGYRVIRGERADVLLVRLDALDRCAGEAFGGFLGMDDFRIVPSNLARNKYYGGAYRRFLDRLTYPQDLVDEVYSSRMMRTLYSASEIESMRARWALDGTENAFSERPTAEDGRYGRAGSSGPARSDAPR